MLTCGEARFWASDYIDGELEPADARELERHLATCQTCPPLLASLTAVLGEVRALPEALAHSDLLTRWRSATADERST